MGMGIIHEWIKIGMNEWICRMNEWTIMNEYGWMN